MNELYYMGLDNCNYLTSSDINYPQYANYRQNKTMFTNPNEGFLKGNIQNNIYKPYKSHAPGNISVNNEKDRLLVEIQMYGFYLTDLGLYLMFVGCNLDIYIGFKSYLILSCVS